MNIQSELERLCGKFEVIEVNPGNCVLCDICNRDFTDSDESGGFLFGSYAIGPCCAEQQLEEIRKYDEEHIIKGYCPADKPFANWVREELR